MEKLLIFVLASAVSAQVFAYRYPSANHSVHVRPYVKRSGGFVQQYYRSKPNQHTKEYNRENRNAES